MTWAAMLAEAHPSPNFGPRRDGARPDLVVIHYTAMADAAAALARLCDPAAEVSAHYLIGADGRLWQLVAEDQRAWHAGAGAWGAVGDVNSRSIGIELDNDGTRPFAAAQMVRLESLLAALAARWRIPPERVIGHADMAPGRKSDPGPRFDWRRLARAGLSVWPETGGTDRPAFDPGSFDPGGFGPGGFDSGAFAAAARAFGYPEAPADRLLAVVRSRFRPWARGAGDAEDLAILRNLAGRFPVDAPGGAA